MKKNLKQKNNFINKFYFWPNFFPYRFLPNFKKLCDSNKSRIVFSEKRFPTTSPFLIFSFIQLQFRKIMTEFQNIQLLFSNFKKQFLDFRLESVEYSDTSSRKKYLWLKKNLIESKKFLSCLFSLYFLREKISHNFTVSDF